MIKKTLLVTLLIVSCSPGAMAQGTLKPRQNTRVGCQPGYSCQNFSVTSPGIPNYSGSGVGTIAIKRAATGASGTVVFFSGRLGTGWYINSSPLCKQLADRLIAADFDIIQVKWTGNGWVSTLRGMVVGQSVLAQRPSTVIYWLKANRARGSRYIIAGGSNGATQIAYALAFYGADSVIDRAVIISGPPYMEIDKGCGQVSGYSYPVDAVGLLDTSYGYTNNLIAGPCYNHNPSWFEFERVNSVEAGLNYYYPRTSIKILLGATDDRFITKRGQDYYNLLSAHGQHQLSIKYVPNTGHHFQGTQQGIDAILSAITQP